MRAPSTGKVLNWRCRGVGFRPANQKQLIERYPRNESYGMKSTAMMNGSKDFVNSRSPHRRAGFGNLPMLRAAHDSKSVYCSAHIVRPRSFPLVIYAGCNSIDNCLAIMPAPVGLALLQGMPAPELTGVAGWKNGSPVKLADFKGKCLILDFWGYWCAPRVHEMPGLFGPAGLASKATCQIAADYGVTSYPTLILIDRSGKIVDEFEPTNAKDIERLEKLLGGK